MSIDRSSVWTRVAVASCIGLVGLAPAAAQLVESRLVVSGLRRPVYMTQAPGDATRLFVVEKQGFIRTIENGTLQPTTAPFLNIDSIVGGGTTTSSEQGLLGLAFHPNYATNRRFYVHYTNNSNNAVIAEYQRSASNPSLADPSTARILLTIPRNATNHIGGWIGFDAQGLLTIASGDSGGGCDPDNVSQNVNSLRGKMLRIDVDADDFPSDTSRNYRIPAANPFASGGGAPEIWLMGLRNPWRSSYDRATGDLYIADVGQGAQEEISFVAASRPSTPIANFEWPFQEGTATNTCNKSGTLFGQAVDPIRTYGRTEGCSITGGYVYRGSAIPGLEGTYFFADYCNATVWSFRYSPSGGVTSFRNRSLELRAEGDRISSIVSFAEDNAGEMYILEQGSGSANGELWQIIRACSEDLNADNQVDNTDFVLFAQAYTLFDCADPLMPAGCPSDFNLDGSVDNLDFVLFAAAYNEFLCP